MRNIDQILLSLQNQRTVEILADETGIEFIECCDRWFYTSLDIEDSKTLVKCLAEKIGLKVIE